MATAGDNRIFGNDSDKYMPASIDHFFKSTVGAYYNLVGIIIILLILWIIYKEWMGTEGYGNPNLSASNIDKYMFNEPSAGFTPTAAEIAKCNTLTPTQESLISTLEAYGVGNNKESYTDKALQTKLY